jgi:Transcription termination factor
MDQTILISEGIRMAKKYGSIEGYKFVNAVLDKYLKLKAQ